MAASASALRLLPSPPAAANPQQRQLRSRVQRPGCLPRRFSKVVSYYSLTTPPYKLDALEPYMSKRTVELHWGKHHLDYVDGLNKQLATSPMYGYTLEELLKEAYNNGKPITRVWNHHFFWESMQPDGGGSPEGGVLQQIEKDFGSFTNFREEFIRSASSLLGSGWVWLVLNRKERKLSVVHTRNAICPLAFGDIPIISLDLWEHAYYLDYKDDRRTYVTNFMDHLVSWHTVTLRMMRAEAFVNLGEPNIPVGLRCYGYDMTIYAYVIIMSNAEEISDQTLPGEAESCKDSMRDTYIIPPHVMHGELVVICLKITAGFLSSSSTISTRNSSSNFKFCSKVAFGTSEHVDRVWAFDLTTA